MCTMNYDGNPFL